MHRFLNRPGINIGRHIEFLGAAPNYRVRYNAWNLYPRLLYHSGLDEVLYYPQVPTRTLGFSLDLLPRVDVVQAKTLTSNLTQQFQAVHADVVVVETFEGALSQQKSFFHSLYVFWRTVLGVDDYMLWRPLDRTDKIYRVRMINLLLGGEEMDSNFVGIFLPDKWLTAPIEVHLKVMSAPPPAVNMFAHGPLVEEEN